MPGCDFDCQYKFYYHIADPIMTTSIDHACATAATHYLYCYYYYYYYYYITDPIMTTSIDHVWTTSIDHACVVWRLFKP